MTQESQKKHLRILRSERLSLPILKVYPQQLPWWTPINSIRQLIRLLTALRLSPQYCVFNVFSFPTVAMIPVIGLYPPDTFLECYSSYSSLRLKCPHRMLKEFFPGCNLDPCGKF